MCLFFSTSYGGGVAALFAHDFPECVSKLILMCPVTRPPVTTALYDRVFSGDYSVFTPDSGRKLINLLRMLANKQVLAPEIIMNAAVNLNFTPARRELIHSRRSTQSNFDSTFHVAV
jgi:pimeloyl-ACP methyl ester carboxylesterase